MLINIRNEQIKHVKYKNAHTYSKYCMFDNQKHNIKIPSILKALWYLFLRAQ